MKVFFLSILTCITVSSANCMQTQDEGQDSHNLQRVALEKLLKLEPEKYYSNCVVQNNQDLDFIKSTESKFAQARKLCLDKNNPNQVKSGISLYKDLALKGHLASMLAIGDFCEGRYDFLNALRWHILGFQASWLFNGEHNAEALQRLKMLTTNNKAKKTNEVKSFLDNFTFFLKCHPLQKNKDFQSIYTLKLAYELSDKKQYGVLEIYLIQNDRDFKASWFYNYYFENYATSQTLIDEANCLIKEKKFDATVRILKNSNDPTALYHLGMLYYDGNIGGKPNHVEAANYFKQSNTPDSLYNMGLMIMEGKVNLKNGQPDHEEALHYYQLSGTPSAFHNIGGMYHSNTIDSKDGKPNYEEAAKWYQLAGTPDSLCNLGNLYKNGNIGLKDGNPDYSKAEALYLESKTPNALWNLGKLIRDGHLGLPDYERAALYFKKANHSGALCDLATLYLRGNIGLLGNGRPDYQSAEKFYCASKSFNAYANLSVIYLTADRDGNESKPDYKKAFIYCGLCESLLSKASSIYEIEPNEIVKVKMAIEMLHRKLTIVQNHYSEVAQFFPSLTPEQAIEKLCNTTSIVLRGLEASDREFYYGILAYYRDKDYDQAMIYFNNALILGDKRALFHIKMIEILKKLIEYFGMDSQNLEVKTESVEVEIPTSEAKESNNQPETNSIPEGKEENLSEERYISTESSSDEKESSLLPPLVPRAILETKDTNKQEIPVIERPKRYKSKPVLSYAEKKRKLLQKVNTLNKRIMGTFEPVHEMRDAPNIITPPLRVKFFNDVVEQEYQTLPGKIKELMSDIEEKPYGTTGTGKPEVLKGKFKGYKGCISRRIDDENRLVYKVTEAREVLILSCSGHYKG